MRRRQVLGAIGVVAGGGTAGCLDSTPGSSRTDPDASPPAPDEFERCGRLIVPISELPDPALAEVETAREDGRYESEDELYLPHLVDPDESYLEGDDGTHYRAIVEREGVTNVLELEEATPSHDPRPLSIANETGEERTVAIRIERVDPSELVHEETLTVPGGATAETAPFERRLGAYRADVDADGKTGTIEWREEEHRGPMRRFVVVEDVRYEPRPVAELVDCRRDVWDLE